MDESTIKEFNDSIKYGKVDALRNILKLKTDFIKKNKLLEEGLHNATLYGNGELVKELLDHGANVDAKNTLGDSPVHVATRKNLLKLVQLFIHNRCNFNQQNSNGETAIMIAARRGYREILSLLCSMGANLNVENKDGCNVLLVAVTSTNLEAVKTLLRIYKNNISNLDINATDKHDQTALMHAANTGQTKIVQLLCDHGANVNTQNRISGQTALHYGALINDTEVVGVLIAAGACPNVVNQNFHTPIYYGKDEIKNMLIKAGAVDTHNTHMDIPVSDRKYSTHTETSKVIDHDAVCYDMKVSEKNVAAHLLCTVEENFEWDKNTSVHDATTKQNDDTVIKAELEKNRMSKQLIEHIYKSIRQFLGKNSTTGTKSSFSTLSTNTILEEKVLINIKTCANLMIGNNNVVNNYPEKTNHGASPGNLGKKNAKHNKSKSTNEDSVEKLNVTVKKGEEFLRDSNKEKSVHVDHHIGADYDSETPYDSDSTIDKREPSLYSIDSTLDLQSTKNQRESVEMTAAVEDTQDKVPTTQSLTSDEETHSQPDRDTKLDHSASNVQATEDCVTKF
ncbi:hypothetical protein Btru_013283 [Bulinus truncatus]|nr:hypothetical protein Btru_013283 [Bulinus truncatus]